MLFEASDQPHAQTREEGRVLSERNRDWDSQLPAYTEDSSLDSIQGAASENCEEVQDPLRCGL